MTTRLVLPWSQRLIFLLVLLVLLSLATWVLPQAVAGLYSELAGTTRQVLAGGSTAAPGH